MIPMTTPVTEYLPDNLDIPDPADTPDLGQTPAPASRWFVTSDGWLMPEMARRAAHRFFERAVEARRCGAARERLDRAVLAYAFAGTQSTATDALLSLSAAVSSWRDALRGITGRTASPETETGTIPMVLA